jgi:tRNA threonylcarbamoyladenosine biosynthesis protein TsaE
MNENATTLELTTCSAEETIAAGRKIAELLQPPLLLLLRGDLGAGKTTLVKGIAETWGAADADEVTSPTFTLLHEYLGMREGKPVLLCHLDLYRVEDERQLAAIGLDDLPTPDAVVLVEWGEKFPALAARSDGEIMIASSNGDARQIRLHLR